MPEAELAHYAQQLEAILEAVATISAVDTSAVTPMSHPIAMTNVFREDIPSPSLTAGQALAGAPAVEEDKFRVPRILDED